MTGRVAIAMLAVVAAAWWLYGLAPSTQPTLRRAEEREPPRPTSDRYTLPPTSDGTNGPAQHPLQAYLLAEADPARDSVLLSMVRDAGFLCEQIVHARSLGDETASWRVSCDEAHTYLLEVDAQGELRVEPLFYGDRPPGAPAEIGPAPNQ
jgi:hypothetical protein